MPTNLLNRQKSRGKAVEKRNCPREKIGKCVHCKPYCHITNGFSGAGAFSDGKLSLYNPEDDDFYVGGNLHKYVGVDETKKLIDYTDAVYLKFGATTVLEGTAHKAEISKIRKSAESVGLDLINIPIRHLGTEKAHELYKRFEDYLIDNGVEIMFDTEVKDLIIENNSIKGIEYEWKRRNIKSTAMSERVVLAVGRTGANWLLNMCDKHEIKTTPGIIDIGVRYELPDEVMANVNKYMYEAKIVGKPMPFADKVRTFCQNPSGFVSTEVYDDDVTGTITCVNGHSMKTKKSNNTNLALLVSMNLGDVADPMEYARRIARNVNAIANGRPIVQRLCDIKLGKRTWPEELANNPVIPTLNGAQTGDLSLCFPYRQLTDVLEFIKLIDKVIPGFANDYNLLYGPEIKFYSNKILLSNNLETSVEGLFAIGDGCGLTRGLMMASASGVKLARILMEIFINGNLLSHATIA